MIPILDEVVLLFVDGLHEGDPDLIRVFHYLSTSVGYESPQRESARHGCFIGGRSWKDRPTASLEKVLTEMAEKSRTLRPMARESVHL